MDDSETAQCDHDKAKTGRRAEEAEGGALEGWGLLGGCHDAFS
jgi:hypothetical protein